MGKKITRQDAVHIAIDALHTAERQRAEYADTEAKRYQDICIWANMDNDYGSWKTSCGEAFSLVSGTPTEHGIRYCPCCELTLREVREMNKQITIKEASEIATQNLNNAERKRQASLDTELRATELEALDRLMAEKVRGWHADSLEQTWKLSGGEPRYPMQRWQPTIYIEQAMECLQEALQSGRVQVYDMIVDTELKVTMVSLYIYKKGETILIGYGRNSKTTPDALAEAICLALKEVMKNEQHNGRDQDPT